MDDLALLVHTQERGQEQEREQEQEQEREQAPVLALDHPETPPAVAHPGSV